MSVRTAISLAVILSVLSPGAAQAIEFKFDFEGCPRDPIVDLAGKVMTVEVYAVLRISDNSYPYPGPQGWSWGLGITGGVIRSVEVEGIQVHLTNDTDLDLVNAFRSVAELAIQADDSSRHGAVSEILLDEAGRLELGGGQRIAKLLVDVTIPDSKEGHDVVLQFEDGFQGTGEPVRNLVRFKGNDVIPSLGRCSFHVNRGFDYAVGFDAPTSPVEGDPGEVKTIEVFTTMSTSGIETPNTDPRLEGVSDWALSIEITGATLQSINVRGIVVDAVFNEYVDFNIQHHEHFLIDLGRSWTNIVNRATHKDDPSRKGAITAVFIDPTEKVGLGPAVLQPNTTQRILRMVLQATVPEDKEGQEVALKFVDGFKSSVSQPVNNTVGFRGRGISLEKPSPDRLHDCRFILRKYTGINSGFSFEGAPTRPVEGTPGDTRFFRLHAVLNTSGNRLPAGASSWALGVGITGGVIKAIDLEGILVSTVYDQDGDPSTPPLSPYLFDLGSAWRKDAELAALAEDPSRSGAISMVVLSGGKEMTLQPNGSQRVARITVAATVPEDNSSKDVVLRFEDGFRSTGSPRQNWINIDQAYGPPTLGECRITLLKGDGGRQVPGDADQSGSLDISDAVSILGRLFLGIPERFPCGDGTPADPGNISLLDFQPDGAVDISDGVALLRFLFLGGPPHHLAIPGKETSGCVPIFGCPDRPDCP